MESVAGDGCRLRVVYVAAQRIDSEPPLYLVQGGGDESKKQWFMRIGGFDETRFLYNDNISPKPEFWNNTLLGSMIPFTTYVYIDAATQRQSSSYLPGYTALYLDDIKFAEDGSGPLQLAYMSPSFLRPDAGPINGVLIYKVNENYTPQTVTPQQTSQDERASTAKTATITTEFGNIVIALKPEVAPKTVENFVKLANSNFYDGTLFHRIMPNFMIQGGDPNTKDQPPQTWGTGGPGYSIDAELSDIKHTKYIVSMARGNDINSAGSQFFIMVGNAPWLDGLYTVFGEVVEGHDVVDKIAALQTNPRDQPLDIEKARIKTIRVN
jgi:dolichyl-diphosphooligosaccharide---protein glycosyltransferase